MHYFIKMFTRFTVAVFIFSCAVSQPSMAQVATISTVKNKWVLPDEQLIPFVWQGDSVNAQWEPFAAMLVPVKLANCPKQFYMQFDLGSPYSVFYGNKVKSIREKYPESIRLNDSCSRLLDFSFQLGNKKIITEEISIKDFGSKIVNWNEKGSIEIIGTIGVDFIAGRVLVMDYPGRKLSIHPTVPATLQPRIALENFIFTNSSILLPAVIKGKKTILYFDTGSSAYELLTNKETCLSLAEQGAAPSQYKVKSWDRILTANTFATNDSIRIANRNIPIRKTTFIEGASNTQVEQMMKLGIGGMTGNKLFLHSVLVLDTRNRMFGVIGME